MAGHVCPLCTCTFKHHNELRRHVRVEHEGKRHKCTVCHKEFKRLYVLKKHMALHSKVLHKKNALLHNDTLLY